jgi:hypothetical protein
MFTYVIQNNDKEPAYLEFSNKTSTIIRPGGVYLWQSRVEALDLLQEHIDSGDLSVWVLNSDICDLTEVRPKCNWQEEGF